MSSENPVGANRPPYENAPNFTPDQAERWQQYQAQMQAQAAAKTAKREPYNATLADAIFAIVCFGLGFLGVRLLLFSGMQGWGVTLYCVVFAVAVLAYAAAKKIRPRAASWYWLAVLQLCGASYSLWPDHHLFTGYALLTVGAAVYWCGTLFGITLQGKTSNWLPLDALNMLFVVPGSNLGNGFTALATLKPGKGGGKRTLRRLAPVVLGLLLCVPLLAVVVPLLISADAGLFSQLLADFRRWVVDLPLWQLLSRDFITIAWQLALGAPLAIWLCAYLSGAAHRRYVRRLDAQAAGRSLVALQAVPPVTVLIVLGVACATYLLFIGCQLPYFFSAFGGSMPGQYALYSEYAREGFFELCRIAALNLVLLVLAALVYKRGAAATGTHKAPGALRFFNIALSVLTLLVLATAFSKMGLYIGQHGFTPKRLMTCVFMVFLAGVYLAVILLQFRRFSIVRFAAVYGAGLLCLLCLCNLDGLVVRYNAASWQAGQLAEFDALIVARSGPAAAETAMAAYAQLDAEEDEAQKLRLTWALYHILLEAKGGEGSSRDNLVSAKAREVIQLEELENPPAGVAANTPGAEGEVDWSKQTLEEWEWQQMEPARLAFEHYYAAQLDNGGYD